MNKTAVVLVILILGGAAAYLYFVPPTPVVPVPQESPNQSEGPRYENAALGFAFEYPDTYQLAERELGNGERWHYNVTLLDKVAAANIPEGGEGPTAITVDVFQNNLDQLTVAEWVANDSRSNFKLAISGALANVTVTNSEKQAVAYTWDGLYRGDSIVFGHDGKIFMLSVTYMTPQDTIIGDFAGLASNFELR